MITRSRRAALNSSSKPSSSSSNSPFDSPSTSKHNNNNNINNYSVVGFGNPDINNGNCLNDDNFNNNNNLRRSSRRLTAINSEKFTGLVQNDDYQLQLQQQQPNGNTIEDIVKDVIGNIVDYVSEPGLKKTVSTTNYTTSLVEDVGIETTKSTNLSSNFLHCNENAIFSLNQPSSSSPPSSSTNCAANVDYHEFDDESGVNCVEAITCEVSFDVDMSKDDCKRCPVCGLYGRLDFEGHLGDRLGKVCSKICADKLVINGKACICVACDKRIASDSQGYLANFGLERSTLCSEECLLKFEKENEPLQKCYSCKKDIILNEDGNPSIFYWQTMEFCSPECIENLQQFWGKKCANCSGPVPQQSLGKYSVRFGNVIKQFCHGSCLEQYKKAVKVCAYCQVNLSGCIATCTSVTGGSSTKRIREFCDPVCRSHYLQMVALRNNSTSNTGNGEGGFSSSAVQCCQCSRIVEKSSCLDVIFRGRKFLICSTFCLSAFKFSFDVTKIICESCSKYGWSNKSANILHYSGFTKLFCSRKCLQMHVLKIRRIQSCLTCNVKKYNFDLVEKYDSTSGDSKLFCSTFCYAAFEYFESQNKGKEPKSCCDWCRKLARLSFHIPSPEKTVRNFCSYSCVRAHQRNEPNSGQFGSEHVTNSRSNSSTVDATFKQPGSSFNYRQSPSSPSCVSDLVRSTESSSAAPTQSSLPSSALSSVRPPSSSSSSSISSSSPYASSSFSTTINDFQRSYPTRSKTSLKEDGTIASPATPSRPTTHHDHNLNTKSIVPSPFFNSNNHCKKSDTRFISSILRKTPTGTNHLTTSTTPIGLQPPATAPLPSSSLSSSSLAANNHNTYSNRSLGLSSPYILDSSAVVGNVADKSTMWQPSRRSKATLCRPIRKDRFTQTDVLTETCPKKDITESDTATIGEKDSNRSMKYIPVPIFVPFFVPVPFPVPLGPTSLLPLPLPTPIPFGFPIDSRLAPSKSKESAIDRVKKSDDPDQTQDEIVEQQQPHSMTTPVATTRTTTPITIPETLKTTNSKEINRKKPKSANKLPADSGSSDTINSNLSNEYQHSTATTNTDESKNVKPVRLKRNAQDYSDCNNYKQQDTNNTNNNNNNNDNYCDDSDTCSNASSSDDREKTKRRRLTIPTHG